MKDSSRVGWRTMVAAIAISLPVLLFADAGRTDQSASYTFSNITVDYAVDPVTREVRQSQAAVTFEVKWGTAQFPGTRRCSFSVLNLDGATIGERTDSLTVLEEHTRATREVPISGDPSSAMIRCDSDRLDDADGHFRFTGVKPTLRAPESGGRGSSYLSVDFSAEWVGDGEHIPSPQICVANVYDASDSLLLAHDFTFTSTALNVSDTTMNLDIQLDDVPTSAEMVCQPFTG